jgi:hypothetical protein
MKASTWERRQGRITHYASVGPWTVTVGEHAGTGQSDVAGECSHSEFLGGRFHDIVHSELGPGVLTAMVRAVEQAPELFDEQRSRVDRILAAWQEVPVDPQLTALAEAAQSRGSRALSHTMLLDLDGPILHLTREDSLILHPDGRSVPFGWTWTPFGTNKSEFQAHLPCPALAWRGRAWMACRDGILIADSEGRTVLSVEGPDEPLGLGTHLRVGDVARNGERMLFRWRNVTATRVPGMIEQLGRSGWVEVEADRGVVARSAPF